MNEPKLTLSKIWGQFKSINRHKWEVAKANIASGNYWEAITHDLSKLSPTEFLISARYYAEGKSSPIFEERDAKGYSLVEQHHHGHNPTHWEYWININMRGTPIKIPKEIIPKMICDFIGAGKTYLGKKWTRESVLNHTKKAIDKKLRLYHPATEKLLLTLLEDYVKLNYKALRKKHVNEAAQKMDYDNIPNCDYYDKKIADLELDFAGENRTKSAPQINKTSLAEFIKQTHIAEPKAKHIQQKGYSIGE